jgi:hypothetical protein
MSLEKALQFDREIHMEENSRWVPSYEINSSARRMGTPALRCPSRVAFE